MSTKYSMKGTAIRADIGSGLAAVPGCEIIGLPDKVVAKIAAGDHASSLEEYLADLPDMEEMDVVMRWDPADTMHAGLEAAVGTTIPFDITIKGAAAPTTNDILTFSAIVLAFKKAPHAYKGGVMMATMTLQPGAVTITSTP